MRLVYLPFAKIPYCRWLAANAADKNRAGGLVIDVFDCVGRLTENDCFDAKEIDNAYPGTYLFANNRLGKWNLAAAIGFDKAPVTAVLRYFPADGQASDPILVSNLEVFAVSVAPSVHHQSESLLLQPDHQH